MKRTALFGGSFDPLTKAHLAVVEKLSERFDEVIVMPSKISPFKQDLVAVDGKIRLSMLNLSLIHLQNVEVSSFELDSEGVSYTYNTVAHLIENGKDITLVMGSDMISSLDKWKNFDYLINSVTFYFIPRPYFEMDYAKIEEYKQKGAKIEIADFIGEEGSSSLLKVAVAFNKQSQVAPPVVCQFLQANDLYEDYKYITSQYERFNMKQSRIEHTYRVTEMAIILAKLHSINVEKAIRGALLHDIGKYTSAQELKLMGVKVNEKAFTCPPSVEHCYTSEAIAREIIGEKDKEVLKSIINHTTGDKNMSDLEKLVFLADYIETGRTFIGVEEVRKASYKSLNQGMYLALTKTIDFIKSKGGAMDKRTLDALEDIKKTI